MNICWCSLISISGHSIKKYFFHKLIEVYRAILHEIAQSHLIHFYRDNFIISAFFITTNLMPDVLFVFFLINGFKIDTVWWVQKHNKNWFSKNSLLMEFLFNFLHSTKIKLFWKKNLSINCLKSKSYGQLFLNMAKRSKNLTAAEMFFWFFWKMDSKNFWFLFYDVFDMGRCILEVFTHF